MSELVIDSARTLPEWPAPIAGSGWGEIASLGWGKIAGSGRGEIAGTNRRPILRWVIDRPESREHHATAIIAAAKLMSLAISKASTERPPASWFIPVATRLQHLTRLPEGWDGPGSVRVNPAVAAKAWQLLTAITPRQTRAPSISPGRDGSLQLAWYTQDLELEIDVPRTGEPIIALYDRNSGQEFELTVTSPELAAAIRQLSAG